jgi:hypothetical protein
MDRRFSISWAFVLAVCVVSRTLLAVEPTKECNIIALAQDSTRAGNIGPVQLDEPGAAVIRSAEELIARSSRAASAKDAAVQKACRSRHAGRERHGSPHQTNPRRGPSRSRRDRLDAPPDDRLRLNGHSKG